MKDIIPTQQRMEGRHCRWSISWESVSDHYHRPPDVDDLKAGISKVYNPASNRLSSEIQVLEAGVI